MRRMKLNKMHAYATLLLLSIVFGVVIAQHGLTRYVVSAKIVFRDCRNIPRILAQINNNQKLNYKNTGNVNTTQNDFVTTDHDNSDYFVAENHSEAIIKNENIDLVSETVELEYSPSVIKVTCQYVFHNTGPACTLSIAVPSREENSPGHNIDAKPCELISNVRMTNAEGEVLKPESSSEHPHIYVCQMPIDQSESKVIRCQYDYAYMMNEENIPQIHLNLESFTKWRGTIGNLDIFVRIPYEYIQFAEPAGFTTNDKGFEWHFTNYDPRHDVQVNIYKPLLDWNLMTAEYLHNPNKFEQIEERRISLFDTWMFDNFRRFDWSDAKCQWASYLLEIGYCSARQMFTWYSPPWIIPSNNEDENYDTKFIETSKHLDVLIDLYPKKDEFSEIFRYRELSYYISGRKEALTQLYTELADRLEKDPSLNVSGYDSSDGSDYLQWQKECLGAIVGRSRFYLNNMKLVDRLNSLSLKITGYPGDNY